MNQKTSGKPPGLPSPPRKGEDGSSTPQDQEQYQEQYPSLPKQLGAGTKQNGGDAAGSGEVGSSQQEGRDPKKRSDKKGSSRGKSEAGGKTKDERIKELERDLGEMRASAESQAKHIRETEERLKRTEELLAARTAELSGTQTFLSTKDRLSEAEVLDIVQDLNQNIYQLAVKLTEEWEKLEPAKNPSQKGVDYNPRYPRFKVPALVRLVREQDSGSLTFLLQSRLCYQATYITSTWDRLRDLAVLGSVYERLSASEGQAVSARWRSLTHTYLSRQPPDPELLVEGLAEEFHITGSFSSTQDSVKFVRDVALGGIKSIVRLSLRLDSVFRLDINSSDMFLLFATRGTAFNDETMNNEYGSDSIPTPGKQDERGRRYRIAGTTEVGLGKSICEGPSKDRRTVILLKVNVVLNTDVATK